VSLSVNSFVATHLILFPTTDLVVRSHVLVFAFAPVVIELFYNGCPTVSGDRASYGPLNIVTIGYCGTTVG